MAFVLLEPDSSHVDVLKKGTAHSVLVRVGVDEERRTNYFIEVGLQPVMACSYLEYHFCLIGVARGRKPEYYWSGLDTPGDISDRDRKEILNVVLWATEMLLKHVKPAAVFIVTHDATMPRAALAKHDAVCVTFVNCGYEVAAADTYQGKRTWLMEVVSSA